MLVMRQMLIQYGHLAATDSCTDIAHAIVIANFLVLIPGRVLAGLGGPLADFIGVLQGIGEEHPAGRTGDDFVAVKWRFTKLSRKYATKLYRSMSAS